MVAGIAFGASMAVGGAVGYVAGAFTPAVGRKIKALFVKDSSALKVQAAKLQAQAAVKLQEAEQAAQKEAAAIAKKV